ncbi:hypothetical protein L209DRAFT_144908 [Thermothelomyces heterothallicus CBS 203.75]
MLFGRGTALFLVSSLLVLPCLSLPTNEQRQAGSQQLGARATYSVVPIDGGSGPGGSGESGGPGGSSSGLGPGLGGSGRDPVTVTVIKTLPHETSFRTVYVTPHTETVVVTKTIRVVDVGPAPTSLTTTASNTSTPSTSGIDPTSSIPPIASPSPTTAVSRPSSASAKAPLQTGFTSTGVSASITSTYDDGRWHTSHPFRNGTVWHQVSRDRRWLRQFV